jgi:CHAD domain-containing protein
MSPHGLQHWIKKVLRECDTVGAGWKADAVHDLRVALRRCRSLADGMRQMDSDRDWRRLKRGGRDLFGALGSLRDAQVLTQWVHKLGPRGDVVRERLLALLAVRTQQHRREAREALRQFDRKEWRRLGNSLAARAQRIPQNGLVAQHLALERWEEARSQDERARHARSAIAWHRTRVALKRFRYTAENFLPRRYAEWESNLKRVQDLLGEVHDLDTLRSLLRRVRREVPDEDWLRSQARIHLERQQRLRQYRSLTSGDGSLFRVWRAGLPRGARQEAAAIARFSAWAGYLDPHPLQARHVAALAVELFDQMASSGVDAVFRESRARGILQVAALLQDVGRAKKDKGHHKASFRLIRALKPPVGWSAQDVREVALVARYHRGAEPDDRHGGFASLAPAQQQRVVWLAALLRFANALAGQHDGRVSGVQLNVTPEAILVQVRGYVNDLFSASHLAQKKHLLEAVAGRPVVVRAETAQTAASVPMRVLQMRSFVA